MQTVEERLTNIEQMVSRATLGTKAVLTFDEAALYTGLSKSDLYKKTSSRAIPHYKPRNKMIYFERAELDNWLLQNKVATIDEIETKAETYSATRKQTYKH
jgi:excisionase family DNA binding protein